MNESVCGTTGLANGPCVVSVVHAHTRARKHTHTPHFLDCADLGANTNDANRNVISNAKAR